MAKKPTEKKPIEKPEPRSERDPAPEISKDDRVIQVLVARTGFPAAIVRAKFLKDREKFDKYERLSPSEVMSRLNAISLADPPAQEDDE